MRFDTSIQVRSFLDDISVYDFLSDNIDDLCLHTKKNFFSLPKSTFNLKTD